MVVFSAGDRVSVNDGRLGTVRYYGPVMFGPAGIWVGLELDQAVGKNNGTVEGVHYFQCRERHGLFVPVERLTLLRGAPPPAPPALPQQQQTLSSLPKPQRPLIPSTPLAEKVSADVPPFQMTETTNRLLKITGTFAKDASLLDEENTPVREKPVLVADRVSFVGPNSSSLGNSSSMGMAQNNLPNGIGMSSMQNNGSSTGIRQAAPSTPKKNIFDITEAHGEGGMVMATAIKANVGTPGTSALSRELLKRQDEVNMLRREVEPLLGQMKRVANDGGPAEHVRMLVARIISMMEQYDKVVARYERQLQKLITHMDRRRQEQDQLKQQAEASLAHKYALLEQELQDCKEQLAASEAQARLLRKEYEQAQRGVSARVAIEEGLQEENAQLRAEVERLKAERIPNASSVSTGATSTSVGSDLTMQQIEMLTAALEAAQQENAELKKHRERFPSHTTDGGEEAEALKCRLAETLRAKDTQEAYFQSLLDTLRSDQAASSSNLQASLAQLRSEADSLRQQLAEQQARAQRYSQAIDQTADKCYAENRELKERAYGLEEELRQREAKMGELVKVAECLKAERETLEEEAHKLKQKLMETLPARPSDASSQSELLDAKKQIAALEQAVLALNEQQRKAATPSKEIASLKRQLAQLDFEKKQVEATLRKERTKIPASAAVVPSTSMMHPERVSQIKSELEALKPALPRLIDRLTSLFRNNKKAAQEPPAALNMENITRVYSDIKASFDSLEAVRRKASACADKLVTRGEHHVDDDVHVTPTMNRRIQVPY